MHDTLTGDTTKSRLFAMAIDNLCSGVLALLVALRTPEDLGQARWAIVVASYLGYYFVQEGVWSTTLGKRLFGLRVVRLDGSAAGWDAAAVRTLTRIVEVNPVLLGALPGGLAVALTKRHQRLGDVWSGCVVRASRSHAAAAAGGH